MVNTRGFSGKICALITAGGKGTRLKPITDFIPKELIMYGPKPFLGYCLELISNIGIEDTYIIVGHKKGAILDYVKDGGDWNLKVKYIYQREALGLGHAVHIAKEAASKFEEILLILGDNVIFPYKEINKMFQIHHKNSAIMTLLSEKTDQPEIYGIIDIYDKENRRIKNIIEKPKKVEIENFYKVDSKYLAVAGIYLFNKRFFDYLEGLKPEKNNEIQLTTGIKNAINSGEKVYTHILNGTRVDIGNPKRYLEEQKQFFEKADLNNIRWGV